MFFKTLLCKIEGDKIILQNGVKRFLKEPFPYVGYYFVTVTTNSMGSYDIVRTLRICSDVTLEEELRQLGSL